MHKETRYLANRIDGLRARLDAALNTYVLLQHSLKVLEEFMSQLDALKDAVRANNDVTKSAVTLLRGLRERLEAVESPEDLTEVIAEINRDTEELADAVTKNTVADPESPGPMPSEPVDPPVAPEPVEGQDDAET